MSLEIIASILGLGGPGYIAMFALMFGGLMAVGSVFAILYIAGSDLVKAISLSLGIS